MSDEELAKAAWDWENKYYAERAALKECQAEVAVLRFQLEQAHTDPTFGVWTRRGIERRAVERDGAWDTVIFLDVDDMSGLNSRLGYQEVDWRIAEGLRVGGAMVGRWYSGDEIVVLCRRAEAAGLLYRVWTALRERGISASWCLSGRGAELTSSVQHASALVQDAKREGYRGLIILAERRGAWTRFHADWLADAGAELIWQELAARLSRLGAPEIAP